MEFRFNLNGIFKNVISKVNYTLLPVDILDGRKTPQVLSQMVEIVDSTGLASAKAQDLHHPITSAEKMRNSDHTLYIMIDPRENDGNGSFVGLLKMGVKNLFLYDAAGKVHEQRTLCVLDFYVHETKQRLGLGKQLFDFMLEDNNVAPCKLAIDKPTQTFLSFLYKHYGLAKIYPQNNNFVLFEGFFDEKIDVSSSLKSLEKLYASETKTEKAQRIDAQSASLKREREDYLPNLYGRHTAFKLQDTMATMIGDGSTRSDQPSRYGEQEDYTAMSNGRHTAVKLQDTMMTEEGSTRTNESETRYGDQEDYSPIATGRHTAFKLQDTMMTGDGSNTTNQSPIRYGDQEDYSPIATGRHTAFKLQDTM